MLEHAAGRRLQGEFGRFFRLLDAAIQPLTAAALGDVHDLLRRGEQRRVELKLVEADDVARLALALFDDYAEELTQLVSDLRGPTRLLKKAILAAAAEREKSGHP